jgi:hypothetical protein
MYPGELLYSGLEERCHILDQRRATMFRTSESSGFLFRYISVFTWDLSRFGPPRTSSPRQQSGLN